MLASLINVRKSYIYMHVLAAFDADSVYTQFLTNLLSLIIILQGKPEARMPVTHVP